MNKGLAFWLSAFLISTTFLFSPDVYAYFGFEGLFQSSALDVGLSEASSCDANGDGLEDLVLGEFQAGSAANGQIRILDVITKNLLVYYVGPDSNGRFGENLARLGDVNNNGSADLLIGAQGDGSSQRGRVFVFDCKVAYLNRNVATRQSFAGLIGELSPSITPSASDHYGAALEVIQDPTSNSKLAFVGADNAGMYGAVTMFKLTPSASLPVIGAPRTLLPTIALPPTSQYGFSLAAGDVTNDGVADLMIGAPRYLGRRGVVKVFEGQSLITEANDSSPSSVTVTALPDIAPPAECLNFPQEFGHALATGHFAGMSEGARVVVGAPYYTDCIANPIVTDEGRVIIYKLNGAAFTVVHKNDELTTGKSHYWGWTVARAGDIDGKLGSTAIYIGGPGEAGSANAGAAYGIYGDETSASAYKAVQFDPPGIENDQRGEYISTIAPITNSRSSVTLTTPRNGSTALDGSVWLYEIGQKSELTSCTGSSSTNCQATWFPLSSQGCADPNLGGGQPTMSIVTPTGPSGNPLASWIGQPLTFSFSGFSPFADIIFVVGQYWPRSHWELAPPGASYTCPLYVLPIDYIFSVKADATGAATYQVVNSLDPAYQGWVSVVQAVERNPAGPGFVRSTGAIQFNLW